MAAERFSRCADCDAKWSGTRAGHCTRCHRTFASDEGFYAHLETFSGIDPESGFKVYKVVGCIDPKLLLTKAGDERYKLSLNSYGTMTWKTRLTPEEKSRLARLAKKGR